MKLYQIFLLSLLFTYISSTCNLTPASTAEECSKLELDDSEKQAGGVACCLTKFSGQNMCTKTDQETYEKALKGEPIEVLGTTYEYHCYKKETEKEKSSSGANNLALSLLVLIFFTLL